jgi:methionine sulfoxide reductase heme-binding subunit
MIALLKSPYFTWILLALPSMLMLNGYATGGASAHDLLHPSGEFSARAMILALYCSPLFALFPKSRIIRSLMKRRRYIGVAAFGYAALHTAWYLIDKGSLSAALKDVLMLSIWTGWLAFLIFVPLAATSNNWSVKQLGVKWKSLQKWVYAAAALAAAHWLFLDYAIGPVLVHFLPLLILQGIRISKLSARIKVAR